MPNTVKWKCVDCGTEGSGGVALCWICGQAVCCGGNINERKEKVCKKHYA